MFRDVFDLLALPRLMVVDGSTYAFCSYLAAAKIGVIGLAREP